MNVLKKPLKRWQKVTLIVLGILLALVLTLSIVLYCVWGDEIATLTSIRMLRDRNDGHLDGAVYLMEVKGGFYLDEFVAQGGASSDAELIAFVTEHITKGLIDLGISESEVACASFTATTQEGDALFGRNYDFAKTNVCIVITEANEGRHASISTVDLQFLGIDTESNLNGLMDQITCLAAPYAPLDGVNDAGVSCGIYMTYQGGETVATDQDTQKPDLTSTTLLRLILDYADDVDEAVRFVTEREKPLALYYFGPTDRAKEVIRRTSSGGACVNDTIMHIANENLPFGGVGNSGMGRYHGRESFDAFSHRRAVVTTPVWLDLPFRYMPYRMFRWVKKIL